MKRIVFELDSVAAIVAPSPKYSGAIEELAASVVPKGIAFDIIEGGALFQLIGRFVMRGSMTRQPKE